jgi:hypothetical protein
MAVTWTPRSADPYDRCGTLTYTGRDKEELLDRWLDLALIVSFRDWVEAFVAWVRNTP